MTAPAKCAHCGEPLIIVLEMDDKPIIDRLERIQHTLDAHNRKEEKKMASIEDGLAEVEAAETAEEAVLATLSADETRELADLAALKTAGDTLTPDQQARFDALTAKVAADTAAVQADDDAINAADPAPAA